MDIAKHADDLLDHLGSVLNLTNLKFDDNNQCFFTLEKKMVFMLYLDDEEMNSIIINLPMGMLPENENRERLMYEMLCGNYCWGITDGATIGVDEETAVISLSYLVQLPLQAQGQMVDIVAKLVAVAQYWMKKIETISQEAGVIKSPQTTANFIRV
ncbi:MAG: type III secretion system chaperone [Desulfobacter sp.]|nr:MAG: type III secretion system chaperone [Desulfobacter sp.]